MPNVLVISPSGEVYDHDCVRWYQHENVQGNIEHYHNIGDAFVFDSSLKLLNFDRLDVLDIRNVDQKAVDRYNEEFDFVFLRGSNYIHAEMDWENAEAVLPKLKIPVIAFGVGAQAPAKGKLELSPRGVRPPSATTIPSCASTCRRWRRCGRSASPSAARSATPTPPTFPSMSAATARSSRRWRSASTCD